MVIAKVTTGMIRTGIVIFARIEAKSETGSDFQKRMLRSRRSP
jgi:hypothetical protein